MEYLADMLWSLNERAVGRAGLDLPRLDVAVLADDFVALAQMDADAMEQAEKQSIRQQHMQMLNMG